MDEEIMEEGIKKTETEGHDEGVTDGGIEGAKTAGSQNENKEIAEIPTIKRPVSHRVFAWIVIVLLVAMYVITLIAAISGSGSTSQLFMMSLGSTVVLPGVLWLHIRLWKHSVEKTLDKHKSM